MIAVCTPTRDSVSAGFASDLVELTRHRPDAFFFVSKGTLLPNQRTELVKGAMKNHCGHILFIDSDMRFPKDTIDRLIAHNKDIIGANVRHRQANKWTAGKTSKGKSGIEQVNQLGFGVTLIRTEVFVKLLEPWFATPYDGEKFIGEDVYFLHQAKEAGYKVFIDHDLSQEIGHIGEMEFRV